MRYYTVGLTPPLRFGYGFALAKSVLGRGCYWQAGDTPPLRSGYGFALAKSVLGHGCYWQAGDTPSLRVWLRFSQKFSLRLIFGSSPTNPGSRPPQIQKSRPAKGQPAFFGAGGGTRTHTVSPPTDFESVTSTIPSHRRARNSIHHLENNFKPFLGFCSISGTSVASGAGVGTGLGMNLRFISVGPSMPGTVSLKLYCHMSQA